MKSLMLAVFMIGSTVFAAGTKPNILIIIADDCTFSDLPVNGGENAKTPHIDSLATQGLVFDRAYLGMAMCSPCRSELYTGRLPFRNGCAWNHGTSRPGTRSMPHHLGDLGYRVGLAGKVHVKPRKVFPFEEVPGFDRNCVNDPTIPHDLTEARRFMTGKTDQPFCLVVALTEPHAPWVMGDPSAYPPEKIKLPPNLADTPETRRDFGRYLAEITYMDSQVGDLLGLLEKEKLVDNTLVLFTSEQGAQFPGNKWTNWDSGLHTTLIARWPNIVPAGKRTQALVQYADVLPTLVEIGGGTSPAGSFDGTTFAKVLLGKSDSHREFTYGMHNNFPEGPPYPIRSVSDGTWRYIRNLTPDRLYFEKHLMGKIDHNLYWPSWIYSATDNPNSLRLVERFLNRPAEQLYHTSEDRFEMNDLADATEHLSVKTRLAAELDHWLGEQGDPGIPLDTEKAHRAAAKNKPLFPSNP